MARDDGRRDGRGDYVTGALVTDEAADPRTCVRCGATRGPGRPFVEPGLCTQHIPSVQEVLAAADELAFEEEKAAAYTLYTLGAILSRLPKPG